MKTASPLRYPGGKSTMTGLLSLIRRLNGFGGLAIAEPFAGGAGAALSLLYLEEAGEIYINDADPAIHDFWWSLVNRPAPFLDLLADVPVCMTEWSKQRATYRKRGRVSRLRRGFSAFYLNRCNRSGIIMNGGPIGGIAQQGRWKLDARFNRADLQSRCAKVAEYRERIHVSSLDGVEFIQSFSGHPVFFFIDPPYFHKGETLYLNSLDVDYHTRLARLLRSKTDEPWVLTYDDCPEIREMYRGWARIRSFSLRYAASERRQGEEVLIAPRWVELPEDQKSAAISW